MERDPNIEIERNPARRGPVVERGATAMGPATAPLAVRQADRVEWGPIWAGFFVSMLILLVLGSLATAIGLSAADAGGPAVTPGAGTGATALIIMLIALFVGGWTTGSLLNVADKGWGALNGVVLSGLALTLTLLFSAAGTLRAGNVLGSLMGAMNMNVVPPTGLPPGVTTEQIAASAASAAGWFTVISLLGIGAAALGGYLAVKQEVEGLKHRRSEV